MSDITTVTITTTRNNETGEWTFDHNLPEDNFEREGFILFVEHELDKVAAPAARALTRERTGWNDVELGFNSMFQTDEFVKVSQTLADEFDAYHGNK